MSLSASNLKLEQLLHFGDNFRSNVPNMYVPAIFKLPTVQFLRFLVGKKIHFLEYLINKNGTFTFVYEKGSCLKSVIRLFH